MTDTRKTLDTLKVGDQVIIYSDGIRNSRMPIATVEKVTAREIRADGRRWLKRTGYEVGASTDWNPGPKIKPATPELLDLATKNESFATALRSTDQALSDVRNLLAMINAKPSSERFEWAATLNNALPHLKAAADALKVKVQQ